MVPTGRRTSAGIADYVRAPQRPQQNLDRAPALGGKMRRHDHKRRGTEHSRPGETRTHLARKDRKLLYHASRLRPEHEIRPAKDSLATRPQFLVKLRSQPLRHL